MAAISLEWGLSIKPVYWICFVPGKRVIVLKEIFGFHYWVVLGEFLFWFEEFAGYIKTVWIVLFIVLAGIHSICFCHFFMIWFYWIFIAILVGLHHIVLSLFVVRKNRSHHHCHIDLILPKLFINNNISLLFCQISLDPSTIQDTTLTKIVVLSSDLIDHFLATIIEDMTEIVPRKWSFWLASVFCGTKFLSERERKVIKCQFF